MMLPSLDVADWKPSGSCNFSRIQRELEVHYLTRACFHPSKVTSPTSCLPTLLPLLVVERIGWYYTKILMNDHVLPELKERLRWKFNPYRCMPEYKPSWCQHGRVVNNVQSFPIEISDDDDD